MHWLFQKEYTDLDDFCKNASKKEMVGMFKGIEIVSKNLAFQLKMEKVTEP